MLFYKYNVIIYMSTYVEYLRSTKEEYIKIQAGNYGKNANPRIGDEKITDISALSEVAR